VEILCGVTVWQMKKVSKFPELVSGMFVIVRED
jgi:hypothetical protein